MKFTKKNILIGSIAFVLLVSIIVWAAKPNQKTQNISKNNNQTDKSKNEKKDNEKEENKEEEKTKAKEIKLEDCKPLTGKEEKIQCINGYYYYQATNNHDAKICDKITDDLTRFDCREKTLLAQDTGCSDENSQACQNITKMDETIKKDDINMCKTVGDTSLQNACVNKFLQVDKTLSKMDNTCSKVKDAKLKTICKDNYYLITANSKNDASICSKISDPLINASCSKNIKYNQIINNNSPEACNIFKDAKNKAECVKQKNIVNFAKDPKLEKCNNFSGAEKQTCLNFYYLQMAIIKKDKTLCSNISMTKIQDECRKAIK